VRVFRSPSTWMLVVVLLLLPELLLAQAKAIATAETNMKASAELYECKRKQGVLTVKVRFKATANTTLELPYNKTYVIDVGSGKKYEVLRDSDKNVIATTSKYTTGDEVKESIDAGETFNAWWKFPAPPATTKKITFSLPNCEPFEDVAITDVP
jgi:hypothetical protein